VEYIPDSRLKHKNKRYFILRPNSKFRCLLPSFYASSSRNGHGLVGPGPGHVVPAAAAAGAKAHDQDAAADVGPILPAFFPEADHLSARHSRQQQQKYINIFSLRKIQFRRLQNF
jgi:hypothetical protein